MARLLLGTTWFDAVPSSGLLEHEYTRLLLQSAESLFPTFYLVPFSPVVTYQGVAKIPDLALIDREYRQWWVVEVERSDHDLFRHVLPQVEVFARANYGLAEADYLLSGSPGLDKLAIREIMRGEQPRVLVISDAVNDEWEKALSRYNAVATVIEVFRSAENRHILRMNGAYPDVPADVLSICRIDPLLTRFLIVESPAALRHVPEETVLLVAYRGVASRWSLVRTLDKVWLAADRANPIDIDSGPFQLEIAEDGRYSLKELANHTRRGR